jgi:hypothetical protein
VEVAIRLVAVRCRTDGGFWTMVAERSNRRGFATRSIDSTMRAT